MGLFGAKKKADAAPAAGEATLSSGERVQVARRVAWRGAYCPRPPRLPQKGGGEVAAGGLVEVLVDNPSSVEALPPMCNELNATHVETIKDPACWRVYIRKD